MKKEQKGALTTSILKKMLLDLEQNMHDRLISNLVETNVEIWHKYYYQYNVT